MFFRTTLFSLAFVLGLVFLAANQAFAVPIKWDAGSGGNDHLYEAFSVPTGITWQDANDAATALGGYLVTITSEEENDFVFNLIDDNQYWHTCAGGCFRGPWIGGFQPPGSPEPDGNWQWVTGESFVYDNWRVGEPGESPFGEDRIHFADFPAEVRSPFWNDLPGTNVLNGYVVEFVPEPSSYVLGGLGLFGLLLLAWRRKRS